MRRRVWILLVIAGLAVLSRSAPVFRDSFQEKHSTTFGDVLRQRYPGWDGFNTCLPDVQGRLDCWAELHQGERYRLIEAKGDAFTVRGRWTRVSAPVPVQPLRTFGAGGTAVANSTYYDWGVVIGGMLGKDVPRRAWSVDGDTTSLPPAIFAFTCRGRAPVRCANGVGDSIVYRP